MLQLPEQPFNHQICVFLFIFSSLPMCGVGHSWFHARLWQLCVGSTRLCRYVLLFHVVNESGEHSGVLLTALNRLCASAEPFPPSDSLMMRHPITFFVLFQTYGGSLTGWFFSGICRKWLDQRESVSDLFPPGAYVSHNECYLNFAYEGFSFYKEISLSL